VREKEEALSQEQQRSSQEKGELRGQLAEKVRRPPSRHLLVGQLTPLVWASLGTEPGIPLLLGQTQLSKKKPQFSTSFHHVLLSSHCGQLHGYKAPGWPQTQGCPPASAFCVLGVFCHSAPLFIVILVCIF
jgi:hypothetical protein